MSRAEPREVLRPSLFERLTSAPDEGRQRGVDLRVGVRELRNEVRRDIERLLNTRTGMLDALVDLPEARASVLAYGLPDFTWATRGSADDTRRICGLIEDVLRRLEPRLDPKTIRVERGQAATIDGNDGRCVLGFRVSAILHVEPIREQVRFDTSIDFDRGQVDIVEVD